MFGGWYEWTSLETPFPENLRKVLDKYLPKKERETPANTTDIPDFPNKLYGVNIEEALSRFPGKLSYLKIIKGFWQKQKEALANMLTALSSGDYEVVRNLAHNTKSTARAVGATVMGGLAERVEVNKDSKDLKTLCANLQVEAEKVFTGLSELFALPAIQAALTPQIGPASMSPEDFENGLQQLQELLEYGDMKAIGAFEKIQGVLKKQFPDLTSILEEQVRGLNSEEARETLNKIICKLNTKEEV